MPHARCVVLIEACEESGSYDLPAYIEHLATRIGELSLVVCLDSGCANYDQLWCTTSLRGLVFGNLDVTLCAKACTRATARASSPSSFRVVRRCSIASRTAAPARSCCRALRADPGAARGSGARAAQVLGDEVWNNFRSAATAQRRATDDAS